MEEPHAEVAPFLRNLRLMLAQESEEILRWTPDGRAFEILDMARMMDAVLPKYFKHRKYTSFQRQLNYFSFKKWTKSKAVVCTFSNEHFTRDRPELSARITRKKSVPSAATAAAKAAVVKARRAAHKQATPARMSSPASAPAPASPSYGQLRVPHAKLAMDVPPSCASFPSPTDVDAMLSEAALAAVQPRYFFNAPMTAAMTAPAPFGGFQSEPDSLEWVDSFLPSLDLPPHAPMGSMMAALMRPPPSLPPLAFGADGFMCLASM